MILPPVGGADAAGMIWLIGHVRQSIQDNRRKIKS